MARMRLVRSFAAAAFLLVAGSITVAHAQQYGPSPYASFADSPFHALFPGSFTYFHLDDFESDTRTPGYNVNAGRRLEPHPQTDSVDWDGPINTAPATDLVGPGSLNGSGAEGFGSRHLNNFEITPEGNGVTLEDEMMKVTTNMMDYQAATGLYTKSIKILKTALGRQA